MKKPILIFSSILLILLTACNNNDHPDIDTSLIDATPAVNLTQGEGADSSALNGKTETQNQGITINPSPSLQAPVSPAGTITPKLNPPHGQPGHSCEIPVGSPLGSNPVNMDNSVPSPAITSPAPMPRPAIPVNSGSVKLNPPHGMPGHSCAIAVGQPLP